MAAGAILFAVPSCDQLAGLLEDSQEEEENNQENSEENVPLYTNIKLTDTDAKITLSFSMNSGSSKYYDAEFGWGFTGGLCKYAYHSLDFQSELYAQAYYLEYKDEEKVSISGRKITWDDTEEYLDQTHDEVSDYAQALKLSLEITNEQLNQQE